MKPNILVFNCHEAWVHQLEALDTVALDIVVGLSGRDTRGWDERMRPVPANARLIDLGEARARRAPYDCIIAHNMTDLLDAKPIAGPRLLVLHTTLEGRMLEEGSSASRDEIRAVFGRYVSLIGARVIGVSRLKADSWGLCDEVIPFAVDPARYGAWSGHLAKGLRIANRISAKRRFLRWDLHERAFAGVPMTLVGHNPGMAGVAAADSWADLRETLSAHRFYVHTAAPALEDGYNMSVLEAMAAGLPVVGNCHPSSPVEHGVSGFLSDDPDELGAAARRLIDDPALARRMGEAARRSVAERFPVPLFARAMAGAIGRVREAWAGRQAVQIR